MKVLRRSFLAAPLGLLGCHPAKVPRDTASSSKRVVVVGAGLAGLAVAHGLRRKGIDVLVLEAQDQPGGRISTLRAPWTDGLYVEQGATHVVPEPNLLAWLAFAGVELTYARPRRDLARATVEGGARTVLAAGAEPPPTPGFTDEERRLGFPGGLRHYLPEAAKADPTVAWPPPELAHLDAIDGVTLLRQRGASDAWITDFGTGHFGEPLARISGAFVVREVAALLRDLERPGKGARIAGGSDVFPKKLAALLGDAVRYRAHVKSIDAGATGVRLDAIVEGRHERIDGARVVCALPYTALRHVEVGKLSALKARAIAEQPMVSVVRGYLAVDERVWLARGESADTETDLPIGSVRDETQLQAGAKGAILGAYLSGERARALAGLDDRARARLFVEGAKAAVPDVDGHLGRLAWKSWDADPFARGAYAWFRPGQMRELGASLYEPEGRVHFAGDHVSYRPGFMHGALASAARVVAEITA